MDQVWTIVSLKEYTDQRFECLDKAVTKAEVANEKRFEGVNEFRNTLSDQQRTLVPRLEYEVSYKSLLDKLEEIRLRIEKLENVKQSTAVVWAYVIGAGGFLTGIVALIIKFFGE